jgi:hypothetical protein
MERFQGDRYVSAIRLTVEFESDGGNSVRAVFDSSSQETTVEGRIYPADLKILALLVRIIRTSGADLGYSKSRPTEEIRNGDGLGPHRVSRGAIVRKDL